MKEIFEVYNTVGDRVFFTYENKCIPSREELKILMADGYKIKIDGKALLKKNINNVSI